MASFSDNFNRADSNVLGASWVERERAGYDMSLQIHGNALGVNSGGTLYGYAYVGAAETAGQFSQISLGSVGTGDIPEFYTCVRISTTVASNILTCYGVKATADGAFLYRFVARDLEWWDVPVLIGQNTSVAFSMGDSVKLEALGSTLTVRRNGVFVMSVADTAITQGRPGIALLRTAAGNGSIWHWDDWFGQDDYTASLVPEVAVCSFAVAPASTSRGGGIRETPRTEIQISPSHEAWHRSRIRTLSLWSGSTIASTNKQQAVSVWGMETVPLERATYVRDLDDPQVSVGVKILG